MTLGGQTNPLPPPPKSFTCRQCGKDLSEVLGFSDYCEKRESDQPPPRAPAPAPLTALEAMLVAALMATLAWYDEKEPFIGDFPHDLIQAALAEAAARGQP